MKLSSLLVLPLLNWMAVLTSGADAVDYGAIKNCERCVASFDYSSAWCRVGKPFFMRLNGTWFLKF